MSYHLFPFKKHITDKVALSILSGMLGALTVYLVAIPSYFLKITRIIYLLYDVELFVKPDLARTIPGFLAGFLIGLIVGGGLSFGFKLLLEWTGSDWIWLKSAAYGAIMWFFWVGAVRHFLYVSLYLESDLKSNMFLLLETQIFMLANTYFMIKLAGDKKVLEN